MAVGDAGVAKFTDRGWRIIEDFSSHSERRVILATHEAGGAELYFSWHKNESTGDKWQVDEARALLPGVNDWFPVPMTALFYVGGEVPASDCISMVKKRAPKELRKERNWA